MGSTVKHYFRRFALLTAAVAMSSCASLHSVSLQSACSYDGGNDGIRVRLTREGSLIWNGFKLRDGDDIARCLEVASKIEPAPVMRFDADNGVDAAAVARLLVQIAGAGLTNLRDERDR